MPLNIPMPDLPGNAFLKGMDSGGSLFTRLMEPRLEREKQKQAHEHFLQELMAKKEAAERSQAFQSRFDPQRQAILQQQLLGLKQKNDPMYDFNKYKALEDMFKSRGGVNNMSGSMPNSELGQGLGVFSPEGLQTAQQNDDTEDDGINYEMLKKHPALRGFFKSQFGVDPLAPTPETPEQKRKLDLQSQIDLENVKTENKTKALEQTELLAVKKDLPALEKSLKGIDELMRIAKSNPDMFGHGLMPDRFAKTTKIKDFGKWQNIISDAIAGLEQKLSSKGNMLALKLASQLKPSHADQQNVAIGKLESMRQQLVDSINNSKTKLGQNPLKNESSSQYRDDDLVIVEGPNGDETMTFAQAKALGAQ